MTRSWCLAVASLFLAAAACVDGGDVEPTPPPPGNALDDASLLARVDAWRRSPLKVCTLDHVIGSPDTADVKPALDADMAMARLQGRMWFREASGELVVLGLPSAPDLNTDAEVRELQVRNAAGVISKRTIQVSLDTHGRCTVDVGDAIHRANLWGSVSIEVHVAGAGDAVTRESQPSFFAKSATEGLGYVELGALDAVRAALNAPGGVAVLARALGMQPEQLASIAEQVPSVIDSADIDGGSAPFVLDRPSLTDKDARPIVPFDASRIDALLPAAGRKATTMRVRTRRWSLLDFGGIGLSDVALEIPLDLMLERRGELLAATVTKVGEPRDIVVGPGASIACFQRTAQHALSYVTNPRVAAGPEYPRAMGDGLVPFWMVHAPCVALTSQWIGIDLRKDDTSMTLVSKLLDPASYVGSSSRGLIPGGWDFFLSWTFRREEDLSRLESKGDPVVVGPGITAQRTLWASTAYKHGNDVHKRLRASMVWNAMLRCRFAPTADEIQGLIGASYPELLKAQEAMDRCPWTR